MTAGQGSQGTGGEGGATVVETHVSALHFVDDVVLKFKKPVKFPFVDLTTLEARRVACEAEVEANRRLSPDVYLGVASVTLGGRVIDHAVVMRRLPSERSLATLVRHLPGGIAPGAGAPGAGAPGAGAPGATPARAGAAGATPARADGANPDGSPSDGTGELDHELRRLAIHLARFHDRAARSSEIDEAARPDALRATWHGCLDALEPSAGRLVDVTVLARIEELAMRYLAGRGPLFERRIDQGRICDGHGDLLADDVFLLDDGPRLLDCIEFDQRLRHVDVVADVAFLVMDLERIGASALAVRLLDLYQEAAGERFPASLVDHYCAERATVRAEVACLRAAQTGDDRRGWSGARVLADLALAHLEAGRVVLGVVSGLPGTGKSALAATAGARLGWPVLSSDEVRRELVAPGWGGPLIESALPGAYDKAVSERTYATLLERAGTALGLGQSVLLDATFAAVGARQQVERLARDTASDLVVVGCEAPAELAAQRMRVRLADGRDASGADEAVARAMAARTRPWARAAVVDTARPNREVVADALRLLRGPAGRSPAPARARTVRAGAGWRSGAP